MMAELERRHANLYHHVPREELQRAAADLDRRIPHLDRNQIIVGLMRIAAMVGDGHTRVEPRKDPAFHFRSLPLKLYWFDDGIWVRAAAPSHRHLVGARLEAVGGVPVDEAIRRTAELASRENAIGPKLYVPIYLAMPDVLHALRLSMGRDYAALTLSKGSRTWTAQVPAVQVDPIWPPDTDISLVTPAGWVDARSGRAPMWLQAPLEYHRLIEIPGRSALYAQLNMVTDTDAQTMEQFGERILDRVRRTNPRAVILDLRLNFGGNGNLRNRFIPSLIRAEDADTRLFVLTARGTFSASQFLLDDLDRLTDAVFIGEAASSRPSGYADGYRSTLPNSGISLRTSIKYWQSGQDMREWTPVDLAPGYKFADYANGSDPAVEAALAFTENQLLENRLAEADRPSQLDALGASWQYRYADFDLAGQRAVQQLVRSGRKPAAFTLARWTAKRLPGSADAATVLAIVADMNGNKAEALAAARRVVELDPNNRSIRPLLERLQKEDATEPRR